MPTPNGLTTREVEVLALIAHGKTYPQIAETLYISPDTVKSHVRHIYEKTDVHARSEAADWYWANITRLG